LGTSNSVIAIMQGSKPQIISNSEGSTITPSVVAYTKKGNLIIGQSAKRQSVVNPENTFFRLGVSVVNKLLVMEFLIRFHKKQILLKLLPLTTESVF